MSLQHFFRVLQVNEDSKLTIGQNDEPSCPCDVQDECQRDRSICNFNRTFSLNPFPLLLLYLRKADGLPEIEKIKFQEKQRMKILRQKNHQHDSPGE